MNFLIYEQISSQNIFSPNNLYAYPSIVNFTNVYILPERCTYSYTRTMEDSEWMIDSRGVWG